MVATTSTAPATKCIGCHEKILISDFRQHHLECKSLSFESSGSDDEVTLDKSNAEVSILLNKKIEENKSKEQNEVIMIQDCGEGPSKQSL